MKKIFAVLLLSTAAAVAQINENNLPTTSTVSDADKVRVVQGGVSKNAPASVIRTITSSKINDLTAIGRSWLTTASPSAQTIPVTNLDDSISYMTPTAFLAFIGAAGGTFTIQEIDGSPAVVGFNILEVPNGSLTDIGGGVARLTFSTGGGGGGTWGSITGTLSAQTDLQAALDGKQPLDSDLTAIAALSTQAFGRSLLTSLDQAAARTTLALTPGVNVQAYDPDLDDLADGTLTGSKVGTGINAANITTGVVALARGGMGVDVSGFANGLYGQISGATADIDTPAEFSSALGITGTPSSTTVLRGDFTWGTPPSTISATESLR
jgi:hypothetical protein